MFHLSLLVGFGRDRACSRWLTWISHGFVKHQRDARALRYGLGGSRCRQYVLRPRGPPREASQGPRVSVSSDVDVSEQSESHHVGTRLGGGGGSGERSPEKEGEGFQHIPQAGSAPNQRQHIKDTCCHWPATFWTLFFTSFLPDLLPLFAVLLPLSCLFYCPFFAVFLPLSCLIYWPYFACFSASILLLFCIVWQL